MLKKNFDIIFVIVLVITIFVGFLMYDYYYPEANVMKIQIRAKVNTKNNTINLPLKVTEVVINPENDLCDLVIKDNNEKEFWVNEPSKENCNYQVGDIIK